MKKKNKIGNIGKRGFAAALLYEIIMASEQENFASIKEALESEEFDIFLFHQGIEDYVWENLFQKSPGGGYTIDLGDKGKQLLSGVIDYVIKQLDFSEFDWFEN